MKSANCISATGFMPSMAQPTAVPMIAFSASGVSQTRFSLNSSKKPSVILNAPPKAPMSSPRQNTDSSARISSRSPSEIACRYVSSGMCRLPGPARPRRLAVAERLPLVGEHAVEHCVRVGHRLLARPGGLGVDQLLGLRPDCVDVDSLATQLLLVALDRVTLRPLLEHLRGYVLEVVMRTVSVHAHGLGLDQRRALAGTGALARLRRRGEHGLDVVAVDLHTREPIALCAHHRVGRELAVVRGEVGELI